jgi:pimeloyl-ACP methyl ester carboxylesterase
MSTLRTVVDDILCPTSRGALSGLVAKPDGPRRGTLVALHGGGTRARYWDAPHDHRSSLARFASAHGWQVIAVDRPGYGASAGMAELRLGAAAQAPLIREAVQPLLASGEAVVLVGHSLGSIVATHCGLDGWEGSICGVALGGVPLAYLPEQRATFDLIDESGPTIRHPGGGASLPVETWFGPDGTWDRTVLDHFSTIMARNPSGEFADARTAPEQLPPLLHDLPLPLQVCVGEHEQSTAPASVIVDRVREVLDGRSAPGEVRVVAGGAHNLSLGGAAPAYHQLVLDFAELVHEPRPADDQVRTRP